MNPFDAPKLFYLLNEAGEPIPCRHSWRWAIGFATLRKESLWRVGYDEAFGVYVSTVFLGLDHRFAGDGPPILWESMIFGGKRDQYQERCAGGRADALAMHQRVMKLAGIKPAKSK